MSRHSSKSERREALAHRQSQVYSHPSHGIRFTATPGEVATRAQELYERGGRKPGKSARNWAKAEYELRIGVTRS